jgi:hypothetical protein
LNVERRFSRDDVPFRLLGDMKRTGYFWSFAVLWCATVGSGLFGLTIYSTAPGEPDVAGADWPAGSGIPFDCRRPNLLVFLHPRCPCSRATLAELERAIASTEQRAAVNIVVLQLEQMPEKWGQTGIWRAGDAIPGAKILTDRRGDLARRFGAATSGQVLLYDNSGRLVFHGGITASRGHEGDNAGRAALVRAINGAGNADTWAPVFGCKLSSEIRKPTAALRDNRSDGSAETP